MRSQQYDVDKWLLDETAKIVLEDKVYSAKIGETNPYVVYDMPVITYDFYYEDGISLWFSNSQELANTFYKSCKKIDALIKEYADKDTQIADESEPQEQKGQSFCTECGTRFESVSENKVAEKDTKIAELEAQIKALKEEIVEVLKNKQ